MKFDKLRNAPFLTLLCGLCVQGFVPVTFKRLKRVGFKSHSVTSVRFAKKTAAFDEVISIYDKRFPNRAKSSKPLPWLSWGVPATDIDGTKIKTESSSSGKTFYDIAEKDLQATFTEMSNLYGQSNALDMCKVEPGILAFDRKNFAPTLKIYGDIFGKEEAKGMVQRNPNLLACKPFTAEGAGDETMQMSYVIAFTRPIGNYAIVLLVALLSVPAFEGILNIPIRANFFSLLSGS